MSGGDGRDSNPVRPKYQPQKMIRVLPDEAEILVSSSEDEARNVDETPTARPMPRVGALIRDDPRSMARRREQLEAIREADESEDAAEGTAENSEDQNLDGNNDDAKYN